MDLEHAEKFGDKLDPNLETVRVGDYVVELPRNAYADRPNFFVRYFSSKSRDEYGDKIHERVQKMENPKEEVYSTLEDENFRRIMSSLLAFRNQSPANVGEITVMAGEKPEPENLQKMNEMGLLEEGSGDYDEEFKLDKDSDAYWYLQIQADAKNLSDLNSMFDEMIGTDDETAFLRSLNSSHTSLEERIRSWDFR